MRLATVCSNKLLAALIALLAISFAIDGAVAQTQSKTRRPPREVDKVPGDYIQLDPLWIPVLNRAGGHGQLGLVVRLWPGDDTRYKACVRTPWMIEAITIEFNRRPLRNDEYDDLKILHGRVLEAIKAAGGEDLYKQVDVLHQTELPDENSAALTRTCN